MPDVWQSVRVGRRAQSSLQEMQGYQRLAFWRAAGPLLARPRPPRAPSKFEALPRGPRLHLFDQRLDLSAEQVACGPASTPEMPPRRRLRAPDQTWPVAVFDQRRPPLLIEKGAPSGFDPGAARGGRGGAAGCRDQGENQDKCPCAHSGFPFSDRVPVGTQDPIMPSCRKETLRGASAIAPGKPTAPDRPLRRPQGTFRSPLNV